MMPITRIILSIVIITYVANAALLSDRNSDAFPLGPYYDTLGDYYVEDPVAEAQSAETDSTDSDYKENEWEHASNMIERQFPESGEWKPNQDKKSQIWCKVRKVVRHHYEPGYEFYPKSYSEYECLPHKNSNGFSENSIFSSDMCHVHRGRCISMQKEHYFLKRKPWELCWTLQKRKINVGCKCLPPKPN